MGEMLHYSTYKSEVLHKILSPYCCRNMTVLEAATGIHNI